MKTTSDSRYDALFDAAANGDADGLRRLLAQGVNPNAALEHGYSPLRIALDYEQWECCYILLDAGFDPNAYSHDGNSSDLMFALIDADDMLIHRILRAGAEVNYQDSCGDTALHGAAEGSFASTIALLLEYGAAPNIRNNWGETPLFYAARRANTESVRLLLAYGADPDIQDEKGRKAIHFAEYDAVRLLLRRRPECRKATPSPHCPNPLMQAAIAENWKDVASHVAEGADIRSRDGAGRTLLHLAARSGRKHLVRRLLAQGADANVTDFFHASPLHYAHEGGHEATYRLLLEAGADPDLPDETGSTALHLALCKSIFEGMLSVLLASGANPDIADGKGETPLFNAVRHGSLEDVEELLAAGASPHHCNKEGRTPLDLARSRKMRALLESQPSRPA